MTATYTNIPAELLIALSQVIENNSDAHFARVETKAGAYYAVFVFPWGHEFNAFVGYVNEQLKKFPTKGVYHE